jgi:hypothetical protein
MFIRKLEKGECTEHQGTWKCRTARLMECDECHNEFVIHAEKAAKQSYCSPVCRTIGNRKAMARAEETKKKWVRIKFGRAAQKTKQ